MSDLGQKILACDPSLQGAAIPESDFLRAFADVRPDRDPSFRFAPVIRAFADSSALHPSCADADEPSWVPFAVALLLGARLQPLAPPPPPETDAEILERIRTGGENKIEGARVLPRDGPQFTLERRNWHANDCRIAFDDLAHAYFLAFEDASTGQREFRRFPGSVSSAYGVHFGKFDAVECVRANAKKWRNNPRNKNHAVAAAVSECFGDGDEEQDAAEVALVRLMRFAWDRKNRLDAASEKGTKMHLAIEWYMNGTAVEALPCDMLQHRGETTLPREQFASFCAEVLEAEGLTPYRTEWSVFDVPSLLSGQIDGIVVDKEGHLHMIDWKRCKVPDLGPEQRSYGKYGTGPCSAIPDNDFGHYSMQQNMYKRILEKNYGVRIKSMRLAQFHPTALSTYRIIDVPDYTHVAEDIMRLREETHSTPKRRKT